MKNYVPYEDYPDGGKAAETDTITVESDTTGEEKRREEEKGERTGWCLHPVHRRAMCTWLASPNSQTLKSRAIDAKP